MKQLIFGVVFLLLVIPLASAECHVGVSLVNQDPYPAMPGEYVKVIFQVTGLTDPSCGELNFEVNPTYPFTLDPGAKKEYIMKSGIYAQDYKSFFLAPYKLRVDEDAIDGENQIEVRYSSEALSDLSTSKKFNITVEDSRTDFEVNIKDYSATTKEATFEILNTGENNVEALTMELPDQNNVHLFGTPRIIVGDLNSNEDDSATFDAELSGGEITLDIIYTDQIGERRTLQKTVVFDPSYFQEKPTQSSGISATLAFVVGLAIPLIWVYIRRRISKKKEKRNREMMRKK